jgi:hypothetical protein
VDEDGTVVAGGGADGNDVEIHNHQNGVDNNTARKTVDNNAATLSRRRSRRLRSLFTNCIHRFY